MESFETCVGIKGKYHENYSWFTIDWESFKEHYFNFESDLTEQCQRHVDWVSSDKMTEWIEFIKGISIKVSNTCNENEILTKTIVYAIFKIDEQFYVGIQEHVGGDVRGYYYDLEIYSLKKEKNHFPSFNSLRLHCRECKEEYDLTGHGYIIPETETYDYNCCGKPLAIMEFDIF